VIRIGKGQCQWVEEDSRRQIKRHAMLLNIGFCLRRGLLIDHRFQSIVSDWLNIDATVGPLINIGNRHCGFGAAIALNVPYRFTIQPRSQGCASVGRLA
jgi:hypothetical protein